jgi:hypothetical protein
MKGPRGKDKQDQKKQLAAPKVPNGSINRPGKAFVG